MRSFAPSRFDDGTAFVAIDGHQSKDDPPQFDAPGNIVFVAVDRATGGVAEPFTPGAITETFIAGTQPGGLARDH